ncbi:PGC-1 and ERR-induced regulator in muscle protein 1 [Myiozetetes cayanensis]|uniref:PGC-1 and ERR-induced regulator in muscle protein 1 n=1 Tax=Myiozetetes cayanensis TaxID=478635 RepID=UPI00215EC19C|nr:PGC-1 and ERR-induced regulator in muscle protein 1 [Myiozetetes cayanensis]
MDNFEYSIQLNDREWAEFFLASEECSLAPASLATAEEQCLSDIEQGDGHASPDRLIPAREGSEPAPGTGSSAPRGVPGDTPLRWQAGGHLSPAELLSGSEDEAELGSVGRFLCESDEPGCLAPAAMPSAQRRQPPRPPAAPLEEASGERAGAEQSSPAGSPSVVRPKVPGQQKKSRKQQRGAGAAEGDRDPGGAAAQGAAQGPGKAPPSSPASSRKSKGKDKAAKAALVRLGSEEAAEAKQQVPGPGVDEGDPAGNAPLRQKGKEPGAQSPGKTKATKPSKAGQAGGLGVRDSAPPIPDNGAVAPSGEACQEMPGKPLQAKNVAAFGGDAAEGACGDPAAGILREPAAEIPGLSPPCFADGASARSNTLDVTWPEMYDYLFCDSQEEEEELGSSVEGRRSPLQREISWPELYEYFFNEPEGKRKKDKRKDRKRKKFGSLDHTGLQNEDPSSAPVKDTVIISVPEVCEHFFPERPRNRMGWRGIFSIAPASEVKRAVGALKSFLQRKRHPVGGEAPTSQALVLRGSGEKFALVPLAPLGRGQVWPEGEDMALALRGTAEDPRVLTHKDMCLVFCAFASWAVKTSDLQAPDAWKTMFLASFGTLSAIRYFRRQVREGHPRT